MAEARDPVQRALEKAAKRASRAAELDGSGISPGISSSERAEHNRTDSDTQSLDSVRLAQRSVDQALKKLRRTKGILGNLAHVLIARLVVMRL